MDATATDGAGPSATDTDGAVFTGFGSDSASQSGSGSSSSSNSDNSAATRMLLNAGELYGLAVVGLGVFSGFTFLL